MVDMATEVSVAKWSWAVSPGQPLPQTSVVPYVMRHRPPTRAMETGVPAGARAAFSPPTAMFWLSTVMRLSPSGVSVAVSVVASRIWA